MSVSSATSTGPPTFWVIAQWKCLLNECMNEYYWRVLSFENSKVCSRVDSFDHLLTLNSNMRYSHDFRILLPVFCILYGEMGNRLADWGIFNYHIDLTFSSFILFLWKLPLRPSHWSTNNLGLNCYPFPSCQRFMTQNRGAAWEAVNWVSTRKLGKKKTPEEEGPHFFSHSWGLLLSIAT